MQPGLRVVSNQKDITELLKSYVQSITITDEVGIYSDTFSLRLSDSGKLEPPRVGTEIKISLGYQETGIVEFGTYAVDEIASDGQTFEVRGKAIDSSGKLKSIRFKRWENTTIGEVAETIAGANGLKATVAAEIRGIKIGCFTQANESDMAFLIRLLSRHQAFMKVTGGNIVILTDDTTVTVGGKELPTITIMRGMEASYSYRMAIRDRYESVKARFRASKEAKEGSVTIGKGEPEFCMKQVFSSEEAAKLAAKAELETQSRESEHLTMEIAGNPELRSERKMVLQGFPHGADGRWRITRATHAVGNGGYRVSIEGERSRNPQE